ncbi:helix-turn-helix domain-containing protein [Roseimaritima ulvae]|uniref:Transcriptional regulatory protein ZraR n=1 Tax=Roseimaritima ulvae TaxID=980254 RepID=A0A5B9QNJ5_9BACT|nr:helix-turn-helix domain-containing protein [Roseimaritima ulvae]QEG39055.1 Transcriptional regulatory protein ZraR [Roseimaritima ulvae]
MPDRKRGTSIRPLARVLDASDRPAWMIDADGKLSYLSASCQGWLGVDIDSLLGRNTRRVPEPDSDLDRLARSLAAPLGLAERGQVHHRVAPPHLPDADGATADAATSANADVLFLALDERGTEVLALAGHSPPPPTTAEQAVGMAIRKQLDRWQTQWPPLAQLPGTMGESAVAARLRRQLLLAGSAHEHLMLVGPVGSGRESAAHAIHRHRGDKSSREPRSSRNPPSVQIPLVAVDGGLMDAELLDATLAPMVHRLGEVPASEATVLLRNLDQMPHDAQGRLQQTCERFESRLWLLAISTVDGESLRADGCLIDELADRLGVYSIRFTSLADRAVDIPVIATAILQRRRSQSSGQAERFSRQTLDVLVSYPWPQNLSELDAAIRHAVRTATGPAILPTDLPLAIRTYAAPDPGGGQGPNLNLDAALSKLERQLISRALDQAGGNRAEAARLLNISRGRLLRKLEEQDADK